MKFKYDKLNIFHKIQSKGIKLYFRRVQSPKTFLSIILPLLITIINLLFFFILIYFKKQIVSLNFNLETILKIYTLIHFFLIINKILNLKLLI